VQFVHAYATQVHQWAGPPPPGDTGTWQDIEPTLYTIGTIICVAALVLWYGFVRGQG
jgi:hypothetical protein